MEKVWKAWLSLVYLCWKPVQLFFKKVADFCGSSKDEKVQKCLTQKNLSSPHVEKLRVLYKADTRLSNTVQELSVMDAVSGTSGMPIHSFPRIGHLSGVSFILSQT